MKRVLHVGCGRRQGGIADLFPRISLDPGAGPFADAELLHLDADPTVAPDLVCRLGRDPIPLPDNHVDLVVAWHVLEHVGRQGETAEWFACFEELYRILAPGGIVYGECPYWDSVWAWADPTHVRPISEQAFAFFNQDSYRIPENMISPYRIACDFAFAGVLAGMAPGWTVVRDPADPQARSIRFTLVARKPFRPWWQE
jgi:SAM-dependent methyltransferase